jgi:hypothetical protein
MAELIEGSYTVQVHERQDLAFVCDTHGRRILAAMEARSGLLPRLPPSPAAGWEAVGDHRMWTALIVPRDVAAWLNACRDCGVDLVIAADLLRAWWADGWWRIRGEQLEEVLGDWA